jgi:hypothetical protein
MRAKRFLFLLLFVGGTLSTGCNLMKYEAINIAIAPVGTTNEVCNRRIDRHAADDAWRVEKEKAGPDANYSHAYEHGFKDGYSDYLNYGGTGLPPATPPPCYRLTCYQSPEGHRAIEDYNAGFAHGAATARASGLRNLKVLPSSGIGLPITTSQLYQPVGIIREVGPPTLPQPMPVPPGEIVPPNALPVPGTIQMPPADL